VADDETIAELARDVVLERQEALHAWHRDRDGHIAQIDPVGRALEPERKRFVDADRTKSSPSCQSSSSGDGSAESLALLEALPCKLFIKQCKLLIKTRLRLQTRSASRFQIADCRAGRHSST